MKNIFKHLAALCLALVLLVAVLPVGAMALPGEGEGPGGAGPGGAGPGGPGGECSCENPVISADAWEVKEGHHEQQCGSCTKKVKENHIWKQNADTHECTVCGKTANHDFGKDNHEPKCKKCNYDKSTHTHERSNNPVGETFSDCQGVGHVEYDTCTGCDQVFFGNDWHDRNQANKDAAPDNHVGFVEDANHQYPVEGNAATCEAGGEYYKVCSGCGAKGTDTFPVDELGHNFAAEVPEERYFVSGANCLTPAIYKKSCSRCGLASDETFTSGNKDPENHPEDKIEWEVCTGSKTHHGQKCTACGNWVGKEHAEDHDYSNVTCGGEMICEVCHYNNGEVKQHVPGTAEQGKNATCTDDGEHGYTPCTVCGMKLVGNDWVPADKDLTIPALQHAWGEWEVETPATCENDGEEKRICGNDESHVDTRPVDKLGHKWDKGTVTKEATYLSKGEILYTCQNDNTHTYTAELPMLVAVAASGLDNVPKTGDVMIPAVLVLAVFGAGAYLLTRKRTA